MRLRGLVITIDGPAGAGKSTVSRLLARRLGYQYLDTGATFRALARYALDRGLDVDDQARVEELARSSRVTVEGSLSERVLVDGWDLTDRIRTPEVSRAASRIAAYPGVREALMEGWRARGRDGGVIVEGRDIGSVVFPDAELKFYIDARAPVRAARRHQESAPASGLSLDEVTRDIARRDDADRARALAPLRPAEGALRMDTSDSTPEEVVERMEREVRRLARAPGGAVGAT